MSGFMWRMVAMMMAQVVMRLTVVPPSHKNVRHFLMDLTTSGCWDCRNYQPFVEWMPLKHTKIPWWPPLSWPGLFPSLTHQRTESFQHGFPLEQSIQPSIVLWLIWPKVTGSRFFKCMAISDAPINWPTCLATMTIWVQQNGVNQLWYLAAWGLFFCFWPWGFRFWACILPFTSLTGCVSSTIFPLIFLRLGSVESLSSISMSSILDFVTIHN